MHVLVTGAGGFVGRGLVRTLLRVGRIGAHTLLRLSAFDLALPSIGDDAPREVLRGCAGDLTDPAWVDAMLSDAPPVDFVFHLASIPGGAAEQDYAASRAVNLDATLALLERCKAQVDGGGPSPVFVFASSIAVFGAMPDVVTDASPTRPTMTYGAQKLVGEILVDDFDRRGWIDGRSLRLPGVLARPPARTGQLSAFLSDMIREVGAGRPFTCPAGPDATTWASSLPCVVESLLHGATVQRARLSGRSVFTLPCMRFTMGELADAIGAVRGVPARSLVRWAPDERIERWFGRFPPLVAEAATAAGFRGDADLATLVRRAVELDD